MCEFFSLVSNGRGKIFYFNHQQREEIKSTDLNPDSHSSIVEYYKENGGLANKNTTEDLFNKWEYNPLTKELECDTLNTKDDTKSIKKFCDGLDFSLIVPELIIKPIVHPFKIKAGKVTEVEIALLKQWNSVYDSVRNSVYDSVYDSVGNSVRNSVDDSVYDYISSFFQLDQWRGIEHEKGVNPFQSGIDLWEAGFVPSFDGELWRLHSGKDAKVVYEISKEELRKGE